MDEIPKITNKQESNEKLTSTLEKVIDFVKLPNFFKGDAALISKALNESNFDLEQINTKFNSLLDNASKNDPASKRMITRLFFGGIKIPAMTFFCLEDNKKGILQKNHVRSYDDSFLNSENTPIHLRNELENNLLVTFTYLLDGRLSSENPLIVDDKIKKRLEVYFDKQNDKKFLATTKVELQEEREMLEEKLSLEREFFKLLKNGKIRYEVL